MSDPNLKGKSNERKMSGSQESHPTIANNILDNDHTSVKQPAEVEAKLDKIVNMQAARERECKEHLIKKLNDIYLSKRKEIEEKFDREARNLMIGLHEGLRKGFKSFVMKASKHYQNILHTYWAYDLSRAQNEFLREYRLILQEKDARIEDLSNRVKETDKAKREQLTPKSETPISTESKSSNGAPKRKVEHAKKRTKKQIKPPAKKDKKLKSKRSGEEKDDPDSLSNDDVLASVMTKESEEDPLKERKSAPERKARTRRPASKTKSGIRSDQLSEDGNDDDNDK